MPTINDLRQQAATIKNATQVGENTATRVGTTFETIADLLEGMGGVTNLSTIDIGSIDTLNTTGDMLVGTPNIYTLTKTIGANTFKVGTLFQFANNGRYDVAQVIVSQFIVDADGRIDTTSADQEVHIFYRLCKTMNGGSLPTPIGTWATWTELGGSGGSGVTIDPYPTQNSGNAVSSGGVFERLQDIASKVDISAIDDIDEYSDMLATKSPFYVVTKTLSGNVFRIGTLMEFANQGRYILYQILATDYVLNDDGTLDTTLSENGGLKLIWRMKQFSGNPPAGVTIGVWSAWSYLSGGGTQPDNEDIDLNASDQLQFANKSYDASEFSGLGRVYLRKNIVTLEGTGKNVLTQAMVNTANTIYHIQYDYDLNGQTITLPAGCVLEFDGGSVKNGTLVGNGTKILSESRVIFDGVTFTGDFIGGVDSEWFNIVYGTSHDNSAELNSLLNLAYLSTDKYVKLRYASTIYVNSVDENIPHYFSYYLGGTVQIKSGVTLDLNGSEIRCITNSNPRYNILYAGKDDANTNTKNICIKNGSIVGDYGVRTSDSYAQGHGVALLGVDGFLLENLTLKSCNGDGIFIGANALWFSEDEETDAHKKNRHNQHGKIVQCICDGNKRQGMSIDAVIECDVENCIFKNTSGIAPQCGVDIEPGHTSNEVSGVNFKECQYKDNADSGLIVISSSGAVSDISAEKCISTGNTFDYTISGNSVSLLSCNTKEERASVRFFGSASGCVVKDCFLSNITFQDTSSTPHSTINGIVFNNCDILATTGTGITFVNPLLSLGGVEFNKCSFDWHTTGVTYFSGNVAFSKIISSVLFNDCDFNLRSGANMNLFHYDFVKCRFKNIARIIYTYDGVHTDFNFKDCEIYGSTTTSNFISAFSLVAGTLFTFNLDNLVVLQGTTMNTGLITIDSYSAQTATLNLGSAKSYIRIPRVHPDAQASAWTINGGFDYPSLKIGATTSKPVAAVAEGSKYFDTTINKAEWFINGVWVDEDGVPIDSSLRLLKISQSDYDNLSSYDNNTLYVITQS